MKKQRLKTNLVALSILTATTVALINAASAFIAYQSFIPKRAIPVSDPLIEATKNDAASQTSTVANNTSVASSSNSASNATSTPVGNIAIGQTVKPSVASTTTQGKTIYQWCSGTNPNLEDAVCEAVISIASDPTPNNPHLSEKAKQSLSLLPKDSTLSMDESSWKASSTNAGTMDVILHTKQYGDVRLKVLMEKQNNIWVVADGQLV